MKRANENDSYGVCVEKKSKRSPNSSLEDMEVDELEGMFICYHIHT